MESCIRLIQKKCIRWILNLYKDGRITAETALSYASNPEMLKKKL